MEINQFGFELVKALKMEDQKVTGIVIEANVGEATKVTIRRFAINNEMKTISQVVEKYKLVKLDET